jgi:hypothetical protein
MDHLKNDLASLVMYGLRESLEAQNHPIIVYSHLMSGRSPQRVDKHVARDDKPHIASRQIPVPFHKRIRNLTGFLRHALIGGGMHKPVFHFHRPDFAWLKQRGHIHAP